MFNFILPIFLLISGGVYGEEKCFMKFCNDTVPKHSDVQNVCENVINGTYMTGRCCISSETEKIIGLDLSSCHLQDINIPKNNFTDLIIMDLRDNELKSVTPGDLIGLVNLNYLWIPYWMPCPGGDRAWNATNLNETYCFFQKNPCIYLNISCTVNGVCEHRGPGSAKCVCRAGHYGYKCMNEGEFPVTSFSVSVAVTAVILSIILWFAHGRDAFKDR